MPGEVVALVGGSGSGKTTLGRAMLRLVPVSAGTLLYQGGISRPFRARPSGLSQILPDRVSGSYSSLDPRMRVGAIVGEALRHHPHTPAERQREVEQALAEVSLDGLAERFPHELSGASASASRLPAR